MCAAAPWTDTRAMLVCALPMVQVAVRWEGAVPAQTRGGMLEGAV